MGYSLRRITSLALLGFVGCGAATCSPPRQGPLRETPAPPATVAAPALPPAPAPPPVPPAPLPGHDFLPEAIALFRVAACGEGDLPPSFDPAIVDAHCGALRPEIEAFRARWVDKARPFFAALVPPDVPGQVVYPFGGGDLVSALTTFPQASEITTLALELAGDARVLRSLPPAALRQVLDHNRRTILRLFSVGHSKTLDLIPVMRGQLPSQLIFSLAALVVHGCEPVSLRYFRLQPDGALRYLTSEEIAAAEARLAKSAQARARLFANVELRFRKRGGDGPVRTYRHISANLDDPHLKADPAVLRHLQAKGRVAVMTKAASYLLGFDEFSLIRRYLLGHMEWMVSDSTGIPPHFAAPAGFEYETYGRYAGPFLPAGREWAEEMRRLWRSQPYRELPFRYGYPDRASQHHLMVTRRRATGPLCAAAPACGNP